MQTERSIDTKLGQQLDKLPMPAGSSFEKEAAWQRLHDRLVKAKRKRKKATMTAGISISVAASLLYFIMLPVNHNEETAKTKDTTRDHSKVVTTPARPTTSAGNETVIEPKSGTDIHGAAKRKEKQPAIKEENQKETAAANLIITPEPIDTAVVQTPVATMPVAKKKWPVVHINELGEPAAISPDVDKPAMATVSKPRLITGFHKPGVYSFEEITDDTIIKQKPKRSLLPFSSLISQKE